MKWILIVVGVLLALGVVVVVIGALLPRDHVASVTAQIAAPPNSVWKAISSPVDFPSWRSDVSSVDQLAAGPHGPSWREHGRNGAISYAVDVLEPPRRLVGRIADTTLAFGGSWEYLVEPDGATGTRLTITERGSVYNPVFRFVSRFIVGQTATMNAYVGALKKHLER